MQALDHVRVALYNTALNLVKLALACLACIFFWIMFLTIRKTFSDILTGFQRTTNLKDSSRCAFGGQNIPHHASRDLLLLFPSLLSIQRCVCARRQSSPSEKRAKRINRGCYKESPLCAMTPKYSNFAEANVTRMYGKHHFLFQSVLRLHCLN